MSLISQSVVGLYNGVSRQPPSMRAPNQCEEQVNCKGSIIYGLYRRGGTNHVAKLSSTAITGTSFFHSIIRDNNEKYILAISNDAVDPIEVYTLDGTKCTIRYGHLDESLTFTADATVKTYVVATNPLTAFSATTIADYTIIANNTVTATRDTTVTPSSWPNEWIVWLKSCQPNIAITINVDGSYKTYAVGATIDSTDVIMEWFKTELETLLGAAYVIDRNGSVLRIKRANGAALTVTMNDGWGGNISVCTQHDIQSFDDAPPRCWTGKVLTVRQGEDKSFGEYYIEYQADRVWKECANPTQYTTLKASTMPHRLVRTGVNQFTLAPILWEPRIAGDSTSAPFPSFVGKKISNLVHWRNRLAILSRDTVCLSRASDYFNFFPATALEVLDNDPVDIAVGSSVVANLRWGVAFEQTMMLLADGVQFTLHSGTNNFTPKSVAADEVTHFACSENINPVTCGSNMYFVSPLSSASIVREYFVQQDTATLDAANITAHCPNYLPTGSGVLAAYPEKDSLFLKIGNNPHIFFYRFHWNGNEKLQSGWSRWEFDYTDILWIGVFGAKLYLVVRKNSEVHLEVIELDRVSALTDPMSPAVVFPYDIHLDRRVDLQGVFDGTYTTWTLPYTDSASNFIVTGGGVVLSDRKSVV